MMSPTPVSRSFAIIYFVARFFRLFPFYIWAGRRALRKQSGGALASGFDELL